MVAMCGGHDEFAAVFEAAGAALRRCEQRAARAARPMPSATPSETNGAVVRAVRTVLSVGHVRACGSTYQGGVHGLV